MQSMLFLAPVAFLFDLALLVLASMRGEAHLPFGITLYGRKSLLALAGGLQLLNVVTGWLVLSAGAPATLWQVALDPGYGFYGWLMAGGLIAIAISPVIFIIACISIYLNPAHTSLAHGPHYVRIGR